MSKARCGFWVVLLLLLCVPYGAYAACPCSIWSSTAVPTVADSGDAGAVELGTKFRADQDGYITAVRFYKSANNTGTHVGSVWTSTGTRLASATFTNETGSGWQQVSFTTPVAVAANTTYIVSYYAPRGHYAYGNGFFAATGVDNAPLHALRDGVDGGNGVYTYGAASAFPSSTYGSSNYWVDVVYTPAAALSLPTVLSTVPAASATNVSLGGSIVATFAQPMDVTTMVASNFVVTDSSAQVVAGTVSYNATSSSLTFTPIAALSAQTSYSARVKGTVRDTFGQAMGTDYTWTFTTAAAAAAANCPCSIWPATTTPSVIDSNDASGIEVGVKFSVDYNGYVTGVRFYKSALNTGTHTGNLWSTDGTKLASVTFAGESGTGWQQANFSTPVPVTAGTTYIVSYYAPSGHYSYTYSYFASSGVDNPPLHALSNASGGNGVYTYGAGSVFPGASYGAANYWVDAVYFQNFSTTAANVSSTTPVSGAANVSQGSAISATFTVPMDVTTMTTTNFVVKDASSNALPGTASYNATTATLTFQPNSLLNLQSSYTATVKGTVRNFLGIPLSNDYSWTFSTSRGCPCTIWPASSVPLVPDSGEMAGVELGVKFQADANGYIFGLRFYKSGLNTGTHVGNLWSAAGTRLATATFTNETVTGWQQVLFGSPVPITAGTTYVASYYAPNGHYGFDTNYFTNAGVDAIPLHAPQSASAGGNGVFTYAATSSFPTSSYNASNYWVDFIYGQGSTSTPPAVSAVTPVNGSTGTGLGTPITVSFSQPMDPTSITAANITVFDSSNSPIPGTVAYDLGSFTMSFQPNPEFAASSTYRAVVSSSVRNINGVAMGTTYSWSFSTTSSIPAATGPGGPILVITSLTNPYTQYLGEILLAEGLNEFKSQDIAGITPSVLASYDVVILGDMKLTPTHVTMFSSWVANGGNLIVMHPDPQLAGLLGLSSTSTALSNAYLSVITSSQPGQGIVGSTMQFHGPAAVYNLAGANMVARLYSNATTPTNNPAVTWINSGAGRAAAFTYDLARSIVYTRQGNPAWVGVQRIPYSDATCPGCDTTIIRAEDMFFGNASFDPQPDWNDLSKVAVPQADEQQRLLANLIQFMNVSRKPLPRFWYLPKGYKAAVIMTGDDHNIGGTSGRFDQYIADSPAGCSVADWTCVRATSYVFPNTPIFNYLGYVSQGFEIANHGDNVTSCTNFTFNSLDSAITTQLTQMAQNYPGLPASKTNRTHCVIWSDWDSEPKVLLKHGIRLDTSYYYWPQQWILDRPGMFTGSGLPMRYADNTGAPIDVYQATTQMPDESLQTFPYTIDTLLDNAIGANGYYGVFTANMHTDQVNSTGSDAIVASAQARGVPIISSLQMLTWLDGRNGSAFSSLSWSANRLSFTITNATGATNIQAMVPARSATNSVTSITRNGTTITYTLQTIKGIQYAVFSGTAGSYQVTYSGP